MFRLLVPNKQTQWRTTLLLNFNPVIRWLTISDVVLAASAGLLAPIFAIFVTDYIPGGNIQVAGIAATIFLLTKSLVQIPAAGLVDKIKGELDDFWVLLIGTIAMSIIPLLYIFINSVMMLYLIQFINGLVTAFTFPSYMAIFTRHIDKSKEGTEWGAYFTLTDLSSAATGAIGGTIALYVGFVWVFIGVSAVSLIGSLALLFIHQYMKHATWLEKRIPRRKSRR